MPDDELSHLRPPWREVDGLNADQLAAMQTMDDARREGVLSDEQARVIEAMIRRGQTAGARKRVPLARKAARS
ncbi:MAG: hypothetical protein J2P24_03275 [Streptosporangiales bacterium]|nr:hypothetical protein [Streptosporangiales bacterium]